MSGSDPDDRRPWKTEAEWQRLRRRMAVAEPIGRSRRGWLWLGAGVAAVLAGVVTFVRLHGAVTVPLTAVTHAGERLTVHLSDGSAVTLAPSSSIRYVEQQSGAEVALDGMAEFQVTHNLRRAFLVRARDAVIADIGTEFVVRGYSDDSLVRVAVRQGAVTLASKGAEGSALQLGAGDVGGVTGGQARRLSAADKETLLGFAKGSLVFDEEPLSRVALELSRWFNVDVQIVDSSLARRRVSATYTAATLDDILNALAVTSRFEYRRDGRKLVLRPRHP